MQNVLTTTEVEIAPAATLLGYVETFRRAPGNSTLGSSKVLIKGEEIFAEGDRPGFFYKVVAGAVRTSKLLTDGRRQIDAFHLPGDIFGIEAGDEHRFSAEALGDTTIISYRRCSLDTLTRNDSDFSRQVVTAIMRSLERAQNHMLLLGRKSAMEKIATFLLDMARRVSEDGHVHLPMSRIDIADHLGLTIETVSRSLTRLEREGIIEVPTHRRSIVLRDEAALRRVGA